MIALGKIGATDHNVCIMQCAVYVQAVYKDIGLV